jgi:hypothetical protein
VFQLTVDSFHEVLAVLKKDPPMVELLAAYRRSVALVTSPPPMPETVNFIRVWNTGLLSTWSFVEAPKALFGRSARTWVSAVGPKVKFVLASAEGVVSAAAMAIAARRAVHLDGVRAPDP